MQHHPNNSGFELISAYNWDSKDILKLVVPRKEAFRILTATSGNGQIRLFHEW